MKLEIAVMLHEDGKGPKTARVFIDDDVLANWPTDTVLRLSDLVAAWARKCYFKALDQHREILKSEHLCLIWKDEPDGQIDGDKSGT